MNWETIFTTQRIGQTAAKDDQRSGFQQDFDRLIFSSSFRRLQNKTQVFPLPGSTFVHNRLTHSLEVASVGRTLGSIVGKQIAAELKNTSPVAAEFYRDELSNVVAAACLAHDIGNPAYGHSGEKAISAYFISHADMLVNGQSLRSFFSTEQWTDITHFEGNANALRILTHRFKGRLMTGLGLTYTTIASILKYPCESTGVDKKFKHRKKFGFFQTEISVLKDIATTLGMVQENETPLMYKRHPFVYLVEAADDICYNIIDMEDAHRLGILPHQLVVDCFVNVIAGFNSNNYQKTTDTLNKIDDTNERISYLRAKAINLLTLEAAAVFAENKQQILEGDFNETLMGIIERKYKALKEVMDISAAQIYNHDTVLEIEIAGYNVMDELLSLFVPAVLSNQRSHKDEKLLKLLPQQFCEFNENSSAYAKVINVLDFISGMTDLYATEMYRKLKGIDIPSHQ